MSKIELSEKQKNALKTLLLERHDQFFSSDEERSLCMEVVKKADNLMRELDAGKESGADLMAWFWGKYLKQEGLCKFDDISKIVLTKRQIGVLEHFDIGEYIPKLDPPDSENIIALSEVIDLACSLIAETNAYKNVNKSRSYLTWFVDEYKKKEKKR
jgi:hypothetical protein